MAAQATRWSGGRVWKPAPRAHLGDYDDYAALSEYGGDADDGGADGAESSRGRGGGGGGRAFRGVAAFTTCAHTRRRRRQRQFHAASTTPRSETPRSETPRNETPRPVLVLESRRRLLDAAASTSGSLTHSTSQSSLQSTETTDDSVGGGAPQAGAAAASEGSDEVLGLIRAATARGCSDARDEKELAHDLLGALRDIWRRRPAPPLPPRKGSARFVGLALVYTPSIWSPTHAACDWSAAAC